MYFRRNKNLNQQPQLILLIKKGPYTYWPTGQHPPTFQCTLHFFSYSSFHKYRCMFQRCIKIQMLWNEEDLLFTNKTEGNVQKHSKPRHYEILVSSFGVCYNLNRNQVQLQMVKLTISFVMTACLHCTTWLQMDRFKWNLIFEDTSKFCQDNSIFSNIWQEQHEGIWTLFRISWWIILRMRNVASKVVERIKTHFRFSNFFKNSCNL